MHHANGKNWYCMTSECIADVIIDVTTVGVVVFFIRKRFHNIDMNVHVCWLVSLAFCRWREVCGDDGGQLGMKGIYFSRTLCGSVPSNNARIT